MSTKQTEALKLALEALEVATTPLAKDRQEVLRAQAAIREALADQCVCGEPDTPGTHRTDGPCLAEQPTNFKLSDYEPDGMHHNKPHKCKYPKCSYPCPDLPDCRDAEQPAQQPYDTHAAPGQSFDTHGRTPPPECKTDAEKTAFAFGWWKALEENRKQPAQQQEPVAWILKPTMELLWPDEIEVKDPSKHRGYKPLYTSPPASKSWVGLTNQELIDLTAIYSGAPLYCAIEAKLKEKNHG